MSALTVEVLDKTGYRLMLDTSDPEDEVASEHRGAVLPDRGTLKTVAPKQS